MHSGKITLHSSNNNLMFRDWKNSAEKFVTVREQSETFQRPLKWSNARKPSNEISYLLHHFILRVGNTVVIQHAQKLLTITCSVTLSKVPPVKSHK